MTAECLLGRASWGEANAELSARTRDGFISCATLLNAILPCRLAPDLAHSRAD